MIKRRNHIILILFVIIGVPTIKAQVSSEIQPDISFSKKYSIEVGIGPNLNETLTVGNDIKKSERTYATTFYKITICRKISPQTFFRLGYYSLYYEYSYKTPFGEIDFNVNSGNTSTRIPVTLKYDFFKIRYGKLNLIFFGEGGPILEFVKGRNRMVTIRPNEFVNENFDNGIYGLMSAGGGISFQMGNSFGINLAGQKTWGFQSFMQKDFINSTNYLRGSALIDGTGYNFSIGLEYKFD